MRKGKEGSNFHVVDDERGKIRLREECKECEKGEREVKRRERKRRRWESEIVTDFQTETVT